MKSEKNMFLIICAVFLVGIFAGLMIQSETGPIYPISSVSEKSINLVAVDQDGGGVAVPLNVEVKHGDGKVLTDIDKLLFWVDTQYSIQTARDVAGNITGIDTSEYDLIYSINMNETGIVGGPSAGAALTIATIAALTNQTVRPDIVITGTINEDGTIGEIGGVLEKAKAAKDTGATILLVPEGQGTVVNTVPKEICFEQLGFTYCRTWYEKEIINIGEESGIDVEEVKTVQEAMNYFFG